MKVFGPGVSLDEIKKEREFAQTVLIAGIPTLIPYDVIQCKYGYGIVFEKAGAESLAYVMRHDINNMNKYAKMFADFLRELHRTEVPEGKLPDIKDRYRAWIDEIKDLGNEDVDMFSNLLNTIGDSNRYVHGDFDLNSFMVKDGEILILDTAGSAHGHPVFDLQSLYASLTQMGKSNPDYCQKKFGLPDKFCSNFWTSFFHYYMNQNMNEIFLMTELLQKYYVLKTKVLYQVEKKHHIG